MDVEKTKYRVVILLTVFVAFIMTVGACFILQSQPILQAGTNILGYSTVQMNMLYPLLILVTVIVYFVQGPITDRVGSQKMMIAALLLTALSMGLMSISTSFSYEMTLLVYCGILGIASGLSMPAMLKTLTEWFPRKGHGNAFGIVISIGGLANWALVNLGLLGLFMSNGGDAGAWMWPWLAMCFLNLVFVPIWFYLTGKKQPATIKEDYSKLGTNGNGAKNNGSLFKNPSLWIWGAVGFTILTNYTVLMMYMPTYIVAVAGFDSSNIIYFMLAMMCIGGPLMGMGGGISDKIGGIKLTKIGLILGLASLIPAFVIVTDFWSMIILMIILAPGGMLAYAAFYRVITEMEISKDQMGTASGIVLGVQWIAAAVVTMLAGMLLSNLDPRSACTYLFMLAGFLPIFGIALCHRMRKWVKTTSPISDGAPAPMEKIPEA
jgi:MFS family permease